MKSLSWVHLNWLILQRMWRAVCFRLQSFDLQNMDAGPSAAIIFNLARCVCKTSRTYRDPTVERTDRFETLARDGSNACCFGAALAFKRDIFIKFG